MTKSSGNYAPRLCGGTFFTLLLQAAKPEIFERATYGKSSQFSESDVFAALIRIAVPAYSKGDKSTISTYKSCESSRVQILNQANIKSFDERVRTNYTAPLTQMMQLLNRFLDVDNQSAWLAKAIIELVGEDAIIPDSASFLAAPNGSALSKAELRTATDICLPALLLGVWHYVVMNRPDNTIGKATYDEWCPPAKMSNSKRPFVSDIGAGITRKLNITMEPEFANLPESDVIEAEVIDDDEAPEPAPPPKSAASIPTASTIFIHNGGNGTQFTNSGAMTINIGGAR